MDSHDPYVTARVHEIQYSVDYERDHAIRWEELLKGKTKGNSDIKTLRRLILCNSSAESTSSPIICPPSLSSLWTCQIR